MLDTELRPLDEPGWSPSGWLDADELSALGGRPAQVRDVREAPPVAGQAVLIGVDADGSLDDRHRGGYDVMLTAVGDAPAPWVSVPAAKLDAEAARLAQAVRRNPTAATILCRLLRCTEALSFDEALFCESLAYSTLLGGAEFRAWLDRRDAPGAPLSAGAPARIERDGDHVTVTLSSPGNGNAMSAGMRDALFEALCAVADDPSRPRLTLKADGRCFSTGGALGEFGSTDDLAKAHVIRTLRNGARIIHALGERADVHVQGAAIGSGLELAAAAATRTASPRAWFQLPELAMGLIPGAGGTVTLPRAIGRHRTAWLALSGRRISARDALTLGLIHSVGDR